MNRKGQLIGPILTLLLIGAIDALAHSPLRIPNPPAILITIVVLSGFLGGIASSLTSATLSSFYFAYYFSLPGQPFRYESDNLKRVVVWAIVTPATAFMVGVLKSRLIQRERDESARLLEMRSLESAVSIRDEFISIASHELKTPLTSLLLQVQMTRRLLAKPEMSTPSRGIDALKQLERQALRLDRLINNMLNLSQITGERKLRLETQETDLSTLTQDVVSRLSEELSRARCEVRVDAPSPVICTLDAGRIEQVLLNLLTNAMKYGAGSPIDVSVSVRNGSGILRVKDHGIGISKADQDRIFERFERASGAASGLGLGLYIARSIVTAHEGSIAVESEPGHGATFTVSIPCSREPK